jgi:predicted transcriptional regulator
VDDTDLIGLTADIVSAHVSNNNISTAEVPGLIRSVYEALNRVGQPEVKVEPAPEPAVPIRSSIKQDYLVCLEDGKKLKMLKRYLRTNYNMSPEDYRAKWGLPKDYPMVAPAYREARSTLAHQIGLGRKPAVTPAAAPKAPRAAKAPAKAEKAAKAAPAKAPAAAKQTGIRAAKTAARRHLGTAKPLVA